MAKIVEMSFYRDSISDSFPNDGTDRADTWGSIVEDILNEFNGTLTIDYSEDGLEKKVSLMFPDEVDLPAVRTAFDEGLNLTVTDLTEIQSIKDTGNYQMTIVNE